MSSKQIYEVTVCESAVEFSERTYEVEASSPEEAQRIYATEGAESFDPKVIYTDNDGRPDEITSVRDSKGLECEIVPQEDSEDEEEQGLAQRLLGAFKEVFAEVVSDWEDVYYGADPEEETEVWSRTDEAKEKGFKRLEAIARGDEDPKTIEVAPEEATYEEVMWCVEMCEVYMPQLDRKRGRQLLQRFIDFEDLQTLDFEDFEEQDDAEMETAMSVLSDNSYESQRGGCPRDEIFAIALFEILKTERVCVCIAATETWYNRDLLTVNDQRGYGHHLFAKQFEAKSRKKFTVTKAVAEWVVYTYEVEAGSEAEALERWKESREGDPTKFLVGAAEPIEPLDCEDEEVTVIERITVDAKETK